MRFKAMNSLDETDSYALIHKYEEVILFDKDINKDVFVFSMYGDPSCGLIGLNNEWVLVGGESLILWKDGVQKSIQNLKWIFEIRQVEDYKVMILTDPWDKSAAIWILDIQSESLSKLRDFPDYSEKPYSEKVKW